MARLAMADEAVREPFAEEMAAEALAEPASPAEEPFAIAPETEPGPVAEEAGEIEVELEPEAGVPIAVEAPTGEASAFDLPEEEAPAPEQAAAESEEAVEPFPEMDGPPAVEVGTEAPWDEGPAVEIPPPPPELLGREPEGEAAEPITRDLEADLEAFEASGRVRRRPEIWERHAALIGEEIPADIDVHGAAPVERAAEPVPVHDASELEEIAAAARLEDLSRLIPAAPSAPPVAAFAAPEAPAPDEEPEPALTTAPVTGGAGFALSDADVDRIARRVVQLLSDKAVRDIAWEVVPEYAERLVRERIAEVEQVG
jgi:hypothetical protein